MKASTLIVLKENLKSLKLASMAKEIEKTVRQAKEDLLGYDDFLLGITTTELEIRKSNRLKQRLRQAKFPLMKPFETFNLDAVPELDPIVFKELRDCSFIAEKRNRIFIGNSGAGKSHLATAIGIEACHNNYKTRFITGYELVNELIEARKEKELSRILNKYKRYHLLILDELGYVPFSKEGAELLFQVLAERHERGSVIITSNLGFADWTQIFGGATLTTALLDRVTHNAKILDCNWKSYRLRETLKNNKKKK